MVTLVSLAVDRTTFMGTGKKYTEITSIMMKNLINLPQTSIGIIHDLKLYLYWV